MKINHITNARLNYYNYPAPFIHALTSTNKVADVDQKVEIMFFTAAVGRRLSPVRSTLSLTTVACPPSDKDLSWPLPGDPEVGEQPLTNPSQESEAAKEIIIHSPKKIILQ